MCIYTRLDVYVCRCMRLCICARAPVCVCVHMHTYVCICLRMYVDVYICTNIQARMCADARICTRARACPPLRARDTRHMHRHPRMLIRKKLHSCLQIKLKPCWESSGNPVLLADATPPSGSGVGPGPPYPPLTPRGRGSHPLIHP